MLKILAILLRLCSRAVLAKHRPKIVAITGSVGKTSAKEAIFLVLKKKHRVRQSRGNYNNDIGVPLTIIDAESQGRSIGGWIMVFVQAARTFFSRHYPEILILEFGADKPGDIEYLMNLARPQVGVLTAIERVHEEKFGSLDAIAREKNAIIRLLPHEGHAILNVDNEHIRSIAPESPAPVITYGFESDAEVRASMVSMVQAENGGVNLSLTIAYQGQEQTVVAPGIFARHQSYAILAGFAAGIAFGMQPAEIAASLALYKAPKGRTQLIEGLHGSYVIDDTYNGSPASAIAALHIFNDLKTIFHGRRIAILGDMLELGDYTHEGHTAVGKAAQDQAVDLLVCVGKNAALIAEGARVAGMDGQNIKIFAEQSDAINFMKKNIRSDDMMIIKGSQGARMERVVKALMAHPEAAEQLLVRQSARWLAKP